MDNPFKKLFSRSNKEDKTKTDKQIATDKGEPWVNVVGFDLDKQNPSQGAFELDWNIHFVNQLRKEGFPGKTDEDVVDNWFQSVCKNVALETWENYQSDPENRFVEKTKIDKNRTEVK
jgi:hypothetical protein